jgi:putative tryptophan/tyrosine transport system substrate-binding protein
MIPTDRRKWRRFARLVEHGWIEGRTIGMEVRWPGGNIELIAALAKELVELKPDVLLSRSTPATAALKRESGVIPIIFVAICGAALMPAVGRGGKDAPGVPDLIR